MTRLGSLAIGLGVLAACAGSREVSKLRYTSTDCPDPKGCEAPLGEQQYQTPDDNHDPVEVAATEAEPPSCKTVATAMTAPELGNYASEDDERASIFAKHHKACEGAKLDAREMACMSTVTDTKHVGYCTRKMGAPTQKVPLLSEVECKATVSSMRTNLQNYGQAQNAPLFEASCIQDGWPSELAQCFVQQYYDPLSQCRAFAPGWVFDQIQARIDKQSTAKR